MQPPCAPCSEEHEVSSEIQRLRGRKGVGGIQLDAACVRALETPSTLFYQRNIKLPDRRGLIRGQTREASVATGV